MERKRSEFKILGRPINLVIGLLVIIIFMLGLFRLAAWLFNLLSWVAPILLIATAIIDYKVIVNYVKWVIKLFKKNVLMGILATVGTIIGFPIAATFLLVQALIRKNIIKINSRGKEKEGEYIDFEELESGEIKIPEAQKRSNQSEDDLAA